LLKKGEITTYYYIYMKGGDNNTLIYFRRLVFVGAIIIS